MKVLILGAGMMSRAIAYDLSVFSNFKKISISDKDENILNSAKNFLKNKKINYEILDVYDKEDVRDIFKKYDLVISAIPYKYNYFLTKIAIETNTNFIDLGGNNDIVEKQLKLSKDAEKKGVTIIPDCGLAPGLVSIITRDIVDYLDEIEYVKIRVGGIPLKPVPPFNYQLVFSANGLINEYVEDSLVLDNKKIISKRSLTDLEEILFPHPFGTMESFLTSGGCSTLPYTFRYIIRYLDYKTIRYPGHRDLIKPIIDLGLGSEKEIKIDDKTVIPRKILIKLLKEKIPSKGKDAVLLKVISEGKKSNNEIKLTYQMIDYFDEKNSVSAMMRTTGYPVSIIAQMINRNIITKKGVFTCENIIPPDYFFKELEFRDIFINKKVEKL